MELSLAIMRDGTRTDEFRGVYGTSEPHAKICQKEARGLFEQLLVTVCQCLFLTKQVRLEWQIHLDYMK